MFNPKEAENEARRRNPNLDAALNRAQREKETYLEPLIGYFARLEAEIANMSIASRFRRDKKPDHCRSGKVSGPSPLYAELNEADYKRAQLLNDLRKICGRGMSLIGLIESLVLDMEATKTE